MVLSINGIQENYVQPRYTGKELMIGIDSSKSNSALAVGDMNGNIIDYIEMNGTADGTTTVDVLKLCQVERQTLKVLFDGSRPTIVGIEDIITKKESKNREETRVETGMTIHLSRFKITAVFMSFISFFQDTFDITPILVNNQSWKSAVLPEEFCKHIHVKGSLAYFKSINSKYQYCSDDVTDSICIFEYLCILKHIRKGNLIAGPEVARHQHKYFFVSPDRKVTQANKVYLYNDSMEIVQNVAVIANGIVDGELGLMDVPIDDFTVEDLYAYCQGQFRERESIVRVVVKRV